MARPERPGHAGDRLRRSRTNLVFYAGAALSGVIGVAASIVRGEPVTAIVFMALAGCTAAHPYQRAGWYEAGYEAATPTLPRYRPGDGGGHAIFATEAIDGDPARQGLMVSTHGVEVRALLDEEGHHTTDWIVTIPLTPGAHIERVHIARHPEAKVDPRHQH